MRTALLAAAASLLLAAPALAAPPYVGWESFGTADGYAEVYVRPEPAGSHPRIGVRYEILPEARKAYGSGLEVLEIDCSGKRVRRVSALIFEKPELGGEILERGGEDDWSDVEPETLNAALMERVCRGDPT